MSEQAQETTLIEHLRDIPETLRAEWEIQWMEDGTPSGHAMAPVGLYAQKAADKLTEQEQTIKDLEQKNRDLDYKCRRKDTRIRDLKLDIGLVMNAESKLRMNVDTLTAKVEEQCKHIDQLEEGYTAAVIFPEYLTHIEEKQQ